MDLVIIVHSPLLLVMVLDQRVVVATFFATLVDADAMEVVGLLGKWLKDVLKLVLLLFDLSLQAFNLLICYQLVFLEHFFYFFASSWVYLLIQRLEALQISKVLRRETGLDGLLLALVAEE